MKRRFVLISLAITLTLISASPAFAPAAHGGGGGGRPAMGGGRPVVVDRSSHGSIRHEDTHVVQRPAEVLHEPVRPEVRHEPARPEVRHDVVVHRDVEADVHRHHFWNDFAFHHHIGVLPAGFISLSIGGLPYFYSDGIYYQGDSGEYQEVYPPVGADIPGLPDGAIEIPAGGVMYYYAGGAFYMQQPDGTFATVPPPIGVVVPELPPGAVQVSVSGGVAYQFNGIYYEPVFVNGVTQYQTFVP